MATITVSEAKALLEQRAFDAVNAIATEVFLRVRARTPVLDKGVARAGWFIESNGKGGLIVGNNVPYIRIIEFGQLRVFHVKKLRGKGTRRVGLLGRFSREPYGMLTKTLAEVQKITGVEAGKIRTSRKRRSLKTLFKTSGREFVRK